MHARAHPHRHYRTLIVLVLAMTGGTFVLFWLGHLAPVTPLRAATRAWNQITVRTDPAPAPSGFFHLRIDERGSLFQSQAWKRGAHNPDHVGAIEIVLTSNGPDRALTLPQTRALSRTVARLQKQHGIADQQVFVGGGSMRESTAFLGNPTDALLTKS